MYQHRDKRFDTTILYDGSEYHNETLLICVKKEICTECSPVIMKMIMYF